MQGLIDIQRRHAAPWLAAGMVLLLVLAAGAGPAFAQRFDYKKTGQAGMTFLKLGVGARPAGMGGVYASQQGEALSIFWNPAGMASVRGVSLSLNHLAWITDIQQHAVAGAASLGRWGVLGVSLRFMNYGTFHGTALSGVGSAGGVEYVDTGTFSVSEYALGLGYAYQVTDRFGVGLHVKRASSQLGDSMIPTEGGDETLANDTDALAFDLGTVYRTGFNDLTFAMAVRNVSGQVTYPRLARTNSATGEQVTEDPPEAFYLPLVYSIGASVDVLEMLGSATAAQQLLLQVEGQHQNDGVERLHLGVEYGFADLFFLRGGYRFRHDVERFSAGFGVKTGVGGVGLRVDYAATQVEYFDLVHRFSLSTNL